MQKVPMTVKGAERLREELEQLKAKERPEVIKAIAEARAHGDLKENAEYHAARERQSFIEGRIADVEGKLSHAQVIDVTRIERTGKVIFGTTVTLVHDDTGAEVRYQIVGEDEADLKSNRISVSSPIARAMIGREIGDVIEVNTPSGPIVYEVVEVEHL